MGTHLNGSGRGHIPSLALRPHHTAATERERERLCVYVCACVCVHASVYVCQRWIRTEKEREKYTLTDGGAVDAALEAGREHPYVSAVYDASRLTVERGERPYYLWDPLYFRLPHGQRTRAVLDTLHGPRIARVRRALAYSLCVYVCASLYGRGSCYRHALCAHAGRRGPCPSPLSFPLCVSFSLSLCDRLYAEGDSGAAGGAAGGGGQWPRHGQRRPQAPACVSRFDSVCAR
jgi:hypothetical protein